MATQLITPSVNPAGHFSTKAINLEIQRTNPPGRRRTHPLVPNGFTAGRCGSAMSANRDRQVLDLMPVVKHMAAKIRRNLPASIEFDDLVGAGVLGLLDATRRFDARKQVKIESYAQHRIRGAILDGLRILDTASRDLRRKHKKMEKALRDVEAKLGRAAEDDEVAGALGISLDQWHHDLHEIQAAGVDWPRPMQRRNVGPVSGENLADENQVNQYDLCYLNERRDIANRALACLPAREREIVTLYHARDWTMKQIGARLRIDESRVSQLHSAAMERLRLAVQGILSRPKPQYI